MSEHRLSDLLDLAIIQKMADAHYRAAGMPIGIIDAIDGSILIGAGWQDICAKFHRVNPELLKRCRESDNYIKEHLVEGEACHYKCKNGLWDIGIPIVVTGCHLATLFLGQFFYEGEVPDRKFFTQQAHSFGLDLDEYLAALDRVPVFCREKVNYILEYDKALANFIADLADHSLLKTKAEEDLYALNANLELLVEQRTLELQEAQAQYLHSEKLSAIGKLSASIAHEFSSPLLGVMTILKGFGDLNLEDKDKALLELAINETARMKNLIRSLQDFHRPSPGKKIFFEMHALIDSVLLLLKSHFKKKRIKTELSYNKTFPLIYGIPDQIKQVFLNLLDNAVDACSDGGRIKITTQKDGEKVATVITDDGIGIDSAQIDQIFQPFYTTKPAVKGTGLGLSISYGIVKSHNGEIRVESQPGKGSSFTIILPINEVAGN